jgi:hypothetical protein
MKQAIIEMRIYLGTFFGKTKAAGCGDSRMMTSFDCRLQNWLVKIDIKKLWRPF